MKAKRRHELQDNTLAKVITQAPTFWQESGGKILLIAVVALAVFLLIQYRRSSTAASAARAVDDLNVARSYILDLTSSQNPFAPASEQASRRRQFYAEAQDRLDDLENQSDDPRLRAEALIARGDLNWAVANLPELPGAATQPSLKVSRDPKELLAAAERAYSDAIAKYPNEQQAVIAARFGLAAIAENRGQWDAARTEYETIAKLPNVPQAYLEVARMGLQRLPTLAQPVMLMQPATLPAIPTLPATASTTRAATAAPGTKPSTRP